MTEIEISYPAPDMYKPGKNLLAAINTALFLKRPLLLSGDPGTGKTACADFVARQLNAHFHHLFPHTKALRFDTKSTAQSSDLFYQYDAVSHFGDKTNRPKESFITFNSFGTAILGTRQLDTTYSLFNNYAKIHQQAAQPFGSVVLVDEIDKAPRDFPNDLLAELEKPPFKFSIKELPDFSIEQDINYPVVVIISSNSEKGLPDAFLRRCVFHHISFPNETQLLEIVESNLQQQHPFFEAAIQRFIEIREKNIQKKPATSELIDWIATLQKKQLLTDELLNWKAANPAYKDSLSETLGIITKSRADFDTINQDIHQR